MILQFTTSDILWIAGACRELLAPRTLVQMEDALILDSDLDALHEITTTANEVADVYNRLSNLSEGVSAKPNKELEETLHSQADLSEPEWVELFLKLQEIDNVNYSYRANIFNEGKRTLNVPL